MRLGIFAITCAVAFAPLPASATPASTGKSSPESDVRPDVVRLKNGGIVRGTIDENIPDQYVVIVTPSGESRRFAWSEVTYAGPADSKATTPSTSAPQPEAKPTGEASMAPQFAIQGSESKVHFSSDGNQPVTVFVHTVTALGTTNTAEGYKKLCTTPCDVTMAAGTYKFGVALGDRTMRPSDTVEIAAGEVRLTATYKSRSGLRTLGWIGLIGGVTAGLYLGATADKESCGVSNLTGYEECTSELNTTQLYAGGTLVVLGLGMMLLALVPDGADVRPEALRAAPPVRTKAAWVPSIAPTWSRGEYKPMPSGIGFAWQF